MLAAYARHLAILSALSLVGALRADEVTLEHLPPLSGVAVSDYADGRVTFRGVSRQYLSKPLRQLRALQLDSPPEFLLGLQQVEQREFGQAFAAFQTAWQQADTPWRKRLIRAWMVRALDEADGFEWALRAYADALAADEPEPGLQPPLQPPPPGDEPAIRRCVTRLEAAAAASRSARGRALLRGLSAELQIYAGWTPLPAELGGSAVRVALLDAADAADLEAEREEDLPLLVKPKPRTSRGDTAAVYGDSLLLRAARREIEHGRLETARRWLERGRAFLPAEREGAWRAVQGLWLLADGQPAAAVDELRAVASDADGEVAAAAVYDLLAALVEMGDQQAAQAAFDTAQTKAGVPRAWRERLAERGAKLGLQVDTVKREGS